MMLLAQVELWNIAGTWKNEIRLVSGTLLT